MSIAPGTRLGHYEIRSKLGEGGMGEVYLAEDTRLRRRVGLKILPDNIAADPSRLLRFEREAVAASALNHPNIPTIFEFGAVDNKHFLASEFVEGVSSLSTVVLAQAYAKQGKRAEAEAQISILRDAAKTRYVRPYFLASIYATLGDKDKAFAELEKSFAEKDAYLGRISVDPFMDPLRDDPRFKNLLKRMNLSANG
jgi:hypothetical protein